MNRLGWLRSRVVLVTALVWCLCVGFDAVAANNADTRAEAAARPIVEKFRGSPAVFIENRGQWDDDSVRFALSGGAVNVGLTDGGPRFQLLRLDGSASGDGDRAETVEGKVPGATRHGELESFRKGVWGTTLLSKRVSPTTGRLPSGSAQMHEFSVRFEGARRVMPVGEKKSPQVFHYHRGQPARWRENVASFEAVVYRGLYEGIDLRVAGGRGGIKYEFVVAPGADWRRIRLRYEGIERLERRDDGSLAIRPGQGWPAMQDAAPRVYQEMDGRRMEIAAAFVLLDERTCAFEITGDYDRARPLVIDPELEWSTYLGGSADDRGHGVAVDGAGNVIVTGETPSSGWVSGGFDASHNGWFDAFVAKLSPTGAHLWSTYLGGSADDRGFGVAVDGAGNVIVTGETASGGWVSGGFDTSYNGYHDGFVAKLSPAGAHLWSSYLGGSNGDGGRDVAVDGAGNVLVTGETYSSYWVSGGFDTSLDGYLDAFVAKLSPSGAHLWSTYLGGSDGDYGRGIAVDGAGNVLVTSMTESSGWVSGGFDTSYNGGWDAFVAKLSPSGAHLWSTYLGGSDWDNGRGVAVDGAGNVLVTGETDSSGWVSGGFDTSYNGYWDAFVAKLSPAGAHVWSTYLGGSYDDWGFGVAVDGAGNVLVTGATASSGWVSGGFDTSHNGGWWDAFVAKLSPTGAHVWSTYLGGSDWDWGWGVAVGGAGNVLVTGRTSSSGWVRGGFDTSHNGGGDAFVAKIREAAPPVPSTAWSWILY